MPQSNGNSEQAHARKITKISVSGYKSISRKQSIEIAPLTILAGTNSSGKSSMMQPLLLLKQTIESEWEPTTLRVNGDLLKFTEANQFLSKKEDSQASSFSISIQDDESHSIAVEYGWNANTRQLEIVRQVAQQEGDSEIALRPNMSSDDISQVFPQNLRKAFEDFYQSKMLFTIIQKRWYLGINFHIIGQQQQMFAPNLIAGFDSELFEWQLLDLIYLPGLRGSPERTYPVTFVGETFKGTFPIYTASVIFEWQNHEINELEGVIDDLKKLNLTWTVQAKRISDVGIELKVGRLAKLAPNVKANENDIVNIADVGLGVSQVLPILVALRVAKPGQLVYIEQPELHLHPRAQTIMAQILADAANRGVQVVVETHSELLIL